jgi:hypothetical protein
LNSLLGDSRSVSPEGALFMAVHSGRLTLDLRAARNHANGAATPNLATGDGTRFSVARNAAVARRSPQA